MADDTTTSDASTPDQSDGGQQDTSATDTPAGDGQLGDGGKKALDSERTARKDAEKRARELEKKVQAFEDANKSELEQAAGRAEQAEQRAQALIDRTVTAEIRAAAAATFNDPEDATAFLDRASYVGDDGDIDTAQIKTDLADLLKRKPHLAKRSGPKPDPSQGAKPGATTDLKTQIGEAEKVRDFNRTIALKRQLAAQNAQTSQ